jgi:hypothetical protein
VEAALEALYEARAALGDVAFARLASACRAMLASNKAA